MSEKKSVLKAFGGVKGVVLLVAGFAAVIAFETWQRSGSGSALQTVGQELGLQFFVEGRRPQLRGEIDGIRVTIGITTDRIIGSGANVAYYTRFRLFAEGFPYAQIVGASLRQRAIASFSDDERIATGDPVFDEAVFAFGEPAELLAHLDAEAREAVIAATEAGWKLEGFTWESLESGRMGNPDAVRAMLDIGLAAARASRLEGDMEVALRERAASDPVAGVREAAARALGMAPGPSPQGDSTTLTRDQAIAALADFNSPRAFDAAMVLAAMGDDGEVVRNTVLMAFVKPEWQAQAIEAMGQIGGPLELAMLRNVTGDNATSAKAAIEAIEARQGAKR